ncbi:hypothetical protein OS493_005916 [Desmophyllum pertusum]|uniref:Uncharacterized protein n=1 Tax=Desmophyllum pertusum TaxID=174260 RepID=A0A9X0CFY0_9CNID|nr:hypothetical protein OS493_005916 [Desmophyllum pertusum]
MASASSATRSAARKRARGVDEIAEDLGLQASGFKFSRQSRYRKVTQKKGSVTKSARKKRRSSFVRGRKERKSLVFSSAPSAKSELYKEIPTGLPPEARLRKLFDACLEGALQKLDNNTSQYNVDGIPNFTAEAKDVFSHFRVLIADSDIVDEAFKPPDNKLLKPNPRNEELEVKAASRLAVTERLKTENEKWDKLLSSHQDHVENKEREHEEEEDVQATDRSPDFLSLEQHQLLSGKPSLKGLMDRLHDMKHKLIPQVDAVAQAVNTNKEYETVCASFINEQVKSFAGTTFDAVNRAGTPRTVIPRLLKKLFY